MEKISLWSLLVLENSSFNILVYHFCHLGQFQLIRFSLYYGIIFSCFSCLIIFVGC